jgi:hypothetical protein
MQHCRIRRIGSGLREWEATYRTRSESAKFARIGIREREGRKEGRTERENIGEEVQFTRGRSCARWEADASMMIAR